MKKTSLLSGILLSCAQLVVAGAASADDWPQWRGPQRDGVWRETGLIDKFESRQLQPVWRTKVSPGYSGPTVANGRVYVTDRMIEPRQIERVLCLDASNGKILWQHSYECPYISVGYTAGPRVSVMIAEGKAYSLGSMGHLFCLDAASGSVTWSKDVNETYGILAEKRMPIWGIAASPLIYRNLLIVPVGAKGASIVAFDKTTGQEVWKSLDDRGQYAAPILIEQAGQPVLVCWTGDSVAGLAPDSGKVYWREEFKPIKMPIGIATPLYDRGRLYVTSFYDGSLMLKLASDQISAERLWFRRGRSEQDTEALHSIISTPVFDGDYIYGVDSYGELRCLNANTGDRIWEDLTATPKARWSTIHFVRQQDRYWMLNERGELLIGKLSPKGFEEISRAKLLEPTTEQLPQRGGVCWSHPAFANRHVFARNDEEVVCVDLQLKR